MIIERIMKPINIRMPAEMIDALKAQAAERGLDFSSHVRSQLSAILVSPADPLKTITKVRR